MMKLIEELNAASSLFDAALGKYLVACSEIQTYFEQTTTLNGVPRVLSDRIAYEVLSVASYEANIKRAKSIINRAKNCSSTTTSIHSLPSEILTRIFHLVVDVRPCGVKPSDHSGNKTSLPKYPDFLSHVCARWRQLVLDLPALWSHIDLIHSHSLSQGFVDRATACVARAGDLPLDIHIRVPSSHDSFNESTLPVLRFLAAIAPKARSLEFTVPESVNEFDQSILERCFANCIPGKLTHFTIADNGYYAPGFIDGGDDAVVYDREDLWYLAPRKGFQDVLRSVVVLQVDGIYPVWTSPAYHGLSELRLTSKSARGITITHSELCDILTSSPKLRILEFDVEIKDPLPEVILAGTPPVHLEDLEVLNVSSLGRTQLHIFFSVISSGRKPLQLTIVYFDFSSITKAYKEAILQFLESSNITTLCMRGCGSLPQIGELLDLCPSLRVLVLEGFVDKKRFRVPCDPPEDYCLPASFCLDTLYMIDCQPDLDKLGRRLQKYPVHTIVIWKGDMYRNGQFACEAEAKTVLSRLCPIVTHISTSGINPTAGWYQPMF